MSNNSTDLKKIISHCKEYGYVFPSSEIYDGLSACYDYGPFGVELKNNIKDYWWRSMVRLRLDVVGLDSSIFMHPDIWKASGHVDAFNDPLIDNKDSKKRYRADQIVENYIDKIVAKVDKEIKKAEKRFGDNFNKNQFIKTSDRVQQNLKKINETKELLNKYLADEDFRSLKKLIEDIGVVCPVSGTSNWTDIRKFNLMFSTKIGSVADQASQLYLRPETAQGIFVNFLSVQKTARMKIPFGIAQIGKSFRNEIIARQFIFRMREFEQMEMQFFVKPGQEMSWFDYWKAERKKWHNTIGFNDDVLKFHDHENLAHYANAATDIEFKFPFGFKELEGIHSRTDFDLRSHERHTNKKLQYFDSEINDHYTPYVVETSIGLDRMFLAVLCNSYKEEPIKDGIRTVLNLPPILAPFKIAILPLVKKDNLPDKSKEIYNKLKSNFSCYYEEKDSIGKRYRRQDALGTPFCVTIDHETLDNDTVTLRYRDSMDQVRISIDELIITINNKLTI
ncbi:MAG: glycine--tRNA ligase [Flavobacteriales bacterium TMED113]|nr:MAG: glycine--tRNA ligase [Flavobacteriales bacterium TMED113]